MTDVMISPVSPEDVVKIREDWLNRLGDLIDRVESWCRDQGWATRRIERKLDDLTIGTYRVPALLMQEGVTRIILEPISRSAPGVEGVVDLYRMPAYDDIATLFYENGQWMIDLPSPDDPMARRGAAQTKPLTSEVIEAVLLELIRGDS